MRCKCPTVSDSSEYTTSDITNNSLLSSFPFESSVSLDSDIINEILQEREQLLNESINSAEVLDDVKQCVNEILTRVDGIVDSPKKRDRRDKRSAVKDNWVRNKRKRAHQTGEAYINRRGKYVEEKKINEEKSCGSKCKFKFSENISMDTRENFSSTFIKWIAMQSMNSSTRQPYELQN